MFDLHFHSEHSDGYATLEQIEAALRGSELRLAALTDHDQLAPSRALAARFAKESAHHGSEPLELWVGTELSTTHEGETYDLLALNIAPEAQILPDYLEERRHARHARYLAIGRALAESGWRFEPDPAMAEHPAPGKPHVVRELRRHHENRLRLEAMGVPFPWRDKEDDEIIHHRLIRPIAKALGKQRAIPTVEAIRAVHLDGGIAVLAHPFLEVYGESLERRHAARELIEVFAEAGLDGLEAFHSSVTSIAVRAELLRTATRLDLLVTAGCDEHTAGYRRLGRELAAGDPLAASMLAAVRERAAERRAAAERNRLVAPRSAQSS